MNCIPNDAMYILFIFLFYLYTCHTYLRSFIRSYTFYLVYTYRRVEHFVIPDDAVDRRKLGL